ESPEDGRLKLLVTHLGLGLRRRRPQLFRHGRSLVLEAAGSGGTEIALARAREDDWAIAVVPLRAGREVAGSRRLELPVEAPQRWRELLTGRTVVGPGIALRPLLEPAPVALLESYPAAGSPERSEAAPV